MMRSQKATEVSKMKPPAAGKELEARLPADLRKAFCG